MQHILLLVCLFFQKILYFFKQKDYIFYFISMGCSLWSVLIEWTQVVLHSFTFETKKKKWILIVNNANKIV